MITSNLIKTTNNGMSEEGRDHELWIHDEFNKYPKDQEKLTRKSSGNLGRLWWNLAKYGDPWQHISLKNVSTCMKDVDTYWKIVMIKIHLERYDLIYCYVMISWIISGWSSCKATRKTFVIISTPNIHAMDGYSWNKHEEKEVIIWRRL